MLKKGLGLLLRKLTKYKIEIISSGGTFKEIKKLGFKCTELSKYTGSFFIGVTDSQHIVDQIPFESHDISMNALITHDEFIEIKI